MTVQAHQLLDIVKQALIELGIDAYKIELTYRSRVMMEWRVNFTVERKGITFKEKGYCSINAQSGEVRSIGLGKMWQ